MIKHKDSHLDHGLTEAQVAYILKRFINRDAFFVETVVLPTYLGTAPCGLYGPIMGDDPIPEDQVLYIKRNARDHETRFIDKPTRPTTQVTVIAGPYDNHPCVLFTAFGGPAAPQEPGDPNCKDLVASKTFWAQHALALPQAQQLSFHR